MARQVFSLLHFLRITPSVGAHRRPQRVGSAFSHHFVQSPNGPPRLLRSVAGRRAPRTDFASPSTDGLQVMASQALRGACITRDRFSLSRAILRGVNHPSEATETPIEIQLRTLRNDTRRRPGPRSGRFGGAEWKAPEVVAAYLRTLEEGGAAYATISRRLTSIHKLVAIAAIAAGDLDYS